MKRSGISRHLWRSGSEEEDRVCVIIYASSGDRNLDRDVCDRMGAELSGGCIGYDHFGIDAHAVKGLMTTIGLLDLSEWAKRHEAAAKSGDYDYVMQEGESFVKAYEEMCRKLCGCLGRSVSDAF